LIDYFLELFQFDTSVKLKINNYCDIIKNYVSEKSELSEVFNQNYFSITHSDDNSKKKLVELCRGILILYEAKLMNRNFNEAHMLLIKRDHSPIKKPINCILTENRVYKQLNFYKNDVENTPTSINSFCSESIPSRIQNNNINFNDYTPCTRTIHMNNWLTTLIQNSPIHGHVNELKHLPKITSLINQIFVLLKKYKITLNTNKNDLQKLILLFIDQIIEKNSESFSSTVLSSIMNNEIFVKAIFVCSLEIVLFIENIEELMFAKICEEINIDIYDFFKILNPFITHYSLVNKI